MKKILLSVFALGAMTSVAMAEPAKMTDAQMDTVTAGFLDTVVQAAVVTQANLNLGCVALCTAEQDDVRQTNNATVNQAAATGNDNLIRIRDRFFPRP